VAAISLSPRPAASADEDAAPNRMLVEQKLRLVELLVASPAVKGGDPGAEAARILARRQQLLAEAKQALAGGDTAGAGRLLDEAMVKTARQTGRGAGNEGSLDTVAQEARYKNLKEQVASYRGSLDVLAKDERIAREAQALQARTDAMDREAAALAARGELATANQRLGEAYRRLVEGLSRLQAGQTVVLSLKFETPDQEYAYEQRRFQSNELLLKMNMAERHPEGDLLRRVQEMAEQGSQLRDEAAELARRGDHRAAIVVQERASTQLIRAMQAMGVPVF
jgi:hypothetical protein